MMCIPVICEILASIAHIDYADVIRLKWQFPEPYRTPFVVAARALEIVLFTLLRVFLSVLENR
jgi:hypothetical protein